MHPVQILGLCAKRQTQSTLTFFPELLQLRRLFLNYAHEEALHCVGFCARLATLTNSLRAVEFAQQIGAKRREHLAPLLLHFGNPG